MSAESSKVKTEGRNRVGDGARRRAARAATLRMLSIDVLETRTLMAVLPATVFNETAASNAAAVLPNYQTNGAAVVSGGNNELTDDSAPSIAIDPVNPLKMVATWTSNNTALTGGFTERVEYGVSTDGGKTWTNEGQPAAVLNDPTSTATPPAAFAQATDASVGFDRDNNFYILWSEHEVGNAVGALRLMEFDFAGNAPVASATFASGPTLVYEWTADQAINPVLAVDSSVPTFSDTNSNGATVTQTDPDSGDIYVSWATDDVSNGNGNFNPNAIAIVGSSNGGISFSGEQFLNSQGLAGNERDATPQMVIGQGSAARAAGTDGPNDPGSPGVAGGQVTAVWDDYGTASGDSPARDNIVSGTVTDGVFSQTFETTNKGIASGITPASGSAVIPQSTTIQIPVNITSSEFTSLSNLTANIAISGGNVGGLSMVLTPPTGSGLQSITLFNQAITPTGTATGQGIAGTGLGVLNGNAIGTTFDDNAARNIVNGASPYTGNFKPEFGSLDSAYGGAIAGSANSPNSVNGTWTLQINNDVATNPATLDRAALDFTSGLVPSTSNVVIAATPVRAIQSGAATASPADPQGIAPAPVIAEDNTLGAYSPYQGRIYVAYVGRPNTAGTPATNTNIYMAVSDDGGTTWTDPSLPAGDSNQGSLNFGVEVNDDNAQLDGDSGGSSDDPSTDTSTISTNPNLPATESNDINNSLPANGRPQFQPSIAVDPVTGTLGLSWYDARNDAAAARVATYVTTSIDGGNSFAADSYANDSQIATDAITGDIVNLGPIPANASAPSSVAQDTYKVGLGSHQGLAMYGGQMHPIWADNQNGGTDNQETTSIYSNVGYYNDGPRVVSATSGPIGQPGDTLNTETQASGAPIANEFLVTFDRPIDPSTFTAADAVVMYRDTTATNVNGRALSVTSVVPVPTSINQFGATQFIVTFADGDGVGTYSLEITSATISDRIRTVSTSLTSTGTPQTVSATPAALTATVPTGGTPTDFVIPVTNGLPAGEVIHNVSVTVTLAAAQDDSIALTLIAPNGSRVTLTRVSSAGSSATGSGGFKGTIFTSSDPNAIPLSQGVAPYPSPPSYLPATSLTALNGGTISSGENWTLEVRNDATTGAPATVSGFSVTYQPATVSQSVKSGNLLDQNNKAYLNSLNLSGLPSNLGDSTDYFASPMPIDPMPFPDLDQFGVNVTPFVLPSTTPFSAPYLSTSLPLILPGPHVVSTSIPGQSSTPDNLVVNSSVSAIDVTFDRDMDPTSFTPASILQVIGPDGEVPGPFTITQPLGNDLTFQINFAQPQTISGTYSITLASTITDANGNALDTNLNAGLDLLRGTTTGATTNVVYKAPATYLSSPSSTPVANVPLTLTDGTTSISTLPITDSYLANDVSVQLNITEPHDPDLQITLVAPNGQSVLLVPSGTGTNGMADFTNTVFADPGNPNYNVTTPITSGAAPFNSAYEPAQALSKLTGIQVNGDWKLVISDASATGKDPAGTLNSWSLTFVKSQPTSGLGEPVADQAEVNFRIFTADPTNPQSSNTWTAIGPAPLVDSGSTAGETPGFAGQVSAIAVDPSDPSGNTVYASGASGGVWKTTDFLTTNPQGPTWIPLTDFGPNSGINIGSIAVFPRNGNPLDSIVIAGTGDSSTSDADHPNGPTSNGVGFIISMDGGQSWSLLDSTKNNLAYDQRDHLFAEPGASGLGTSVAKIVVDPHLSPTGQVIIYAALTGVNGGLWKSTNTGQSWSLLSTAAMGSATDVTLDLNSATVNTLTNPTGNVNIIYAAFPGSGVYISPNAGASFNPMAGGTTDPLIDYVSSSGTGVPVPVTNGANAPIGTVGGRIFLAKPALVPASNPNADVENLQYERWLYAAVFNNSGFVGEYLTKDNGQTWTELQITGLNAGSGVVSPAIPTNDSTQPQYNVAAGSGFQYGDYDSAFAIDPTDPNITYIGGTENDNASGFIRVDATTVEDSHALVPTSNSKNDGGLSRYNSTGAVAITNKNDAYPYFDGTSTTTPSAHVPYLNLTLDPNNPFGQSSTIYVYNTASFTNDGYGVKWTPIDAMLSATATSVDPSSNIHSIITFVDPLTGETRLLVGDDQGIFSGELTANGQLTTSVGNQSIPAYSRNGNLQLAQVNDVAAQPSVTLSDGTTEPAGLIYSNSDNLGQFATDPSILTNGNIAGQGSTDGSMRNGVPVGFYSTTSADQQGIGVGVDQQGNDVIYRYLDPAYGGNSNEFLQVSTDGGQTWTPRVTGLVPSTPPTVPLWPAQSPRYGGSTNTLTGTENPGTGAIPFGLFEVNPLDSDQVLISSNTGEIFETTNQGDFWNSIGTPDGSYAPALAYGAPATAGSGNLNDFIYAGTVDGNIFVSTNGGAFTNISTGLDGSPVVQIITDPNRGTTDAYAVTQQGVYYNPNTTAAGSSWTNITNNLFSITGVPFGVTNATATDPNAAQPNAAEPLLSYLTSIQADWRYVIPNTVAAGVTPVAGAPTTHPVLYVAGDGGVFRSLDNGATWSQFPSVAVDSAPADGGLLPVVQVTALTTSIGKIDPTNGLPVTAAGDPDALIASTYGLGDYEIRLAPLVLPGTVAFTAGSVSGTDSSGNPLVKTTTPTITGSSEQSAYGNIVTINIYDSLNPTVSIGTGQTNATGQFSIKINQSGFTTTGPQTLLIQATDASGTTGNIASLPFTLQTPITSHSAPAVPTLGLEPGSDSSNGLDITNDTSPFVGGVTSPGVSVNGYIVSGPGATTGQVFSPVISDSNGDYKFQLTNLAPGTYVIQADATNPTNGLTSKSLNFTFTIETKGPTVAPTFYLANASGLPIAGRDVTTTSRVPVFVGQTADNAVVSIYAVNSQTGVIQPGALNTVHANASGHYTITLPTSLNDGTIKLVVQVTDTAGNPAENAAGQPLPSPSLTLSVVTAPADYSGGGKTLPALFSRNANGTVSFIIKGVTPSTGTVFAGGSATQDIPLVGDFDGDGKSDEALYRPSAGAFFIARSSAGGETVVLNPNPPAGTVPVVGDFDGFGDSEVGLYTPSTGVWTLDETGGVNGVGAGIVTVKFNNPAVFTPEPGDVPVPGNYDGTGIDELAVYRPSTGQFFIKVGATPTNGIDNIRVITPDPNSNRNPADVPVPGNYDSTTTQQFTEAAVFDPATDDWYIQGHNGQPIQFGDPANNDIPAPGDYDALGHTELAVYQPKGTDFVVDGPTGVVPLGQTGDVPLLAPLAYRTPPTAPTVALFNASSPGGTFTTARHPIFGGVATSGAVVQLINSSGTVVNSAIADGEGNYEIGDPATLANGTYTYTVRAIGLVGGIGPSSPVQTITVNTASGDFTGAGVTQPALFVRGPSNALTVYVRNDAPLNGLHAPAGTEVPTFGDFYGKGTDQVVFYNPSTGDWYLNGAATDYKTVTYLTAFGPGNTFIPVPADYADNGLDQAAVYRTTTGQWYINGVAGSSTISGITAAAGDVPVPANYDTTGKAELAIYRPSTQTWYIQGPDGVHTATVAVPGGGSTTDIPVPGTYFATAASPTATEAVWRPSTGKYYILNPTNGTTVTDTFAPGDIPAPGDYTGVGHDEAAVFRPSTGQFFVILPNSTTPQVVYPASQPFGGAGFIPLEAPYSYRAVPVTSSAVKAAALVLTPSSVDLGATARSFTTPIAPKSLTPAAASAPVSAALARTRPLQSVAVPAAKVKPLSMLKAHVSSKKGA